MNMAAADFEREARALLAEHLLVDGHNDLAWEIREWGRDLEGYGFATGAPHETDLPRLRAGGLGAQLWSVFVPGNETCRQEGFARTQLEQIELMLRLIEAHPEALELARSTAEIRAARMRGRLASILAMEGGQGLEGSLGALRAYHRLGVRAMTLTHNEHVGWAASATDAPRPEGLTDLGREVVRDMNRLGMMVDLSHVSEATAWDALEVSQAPVFFSHSCCRALVDSARNVRDDLMRAVAARGGLLMITFVPSFLSAEVLAWQRELLAQTSYGSPEYLALEQQWIAAGRQRPVATVAQVADHLDHARAVMGEDHIGLGADFWGGETPQGLEDVACYPVLFSELYRRGWNNSALIKLAGENFMRFFEAVESCSGKGNPQ